MALFWLPIINLSLFIISKPDGSTYEVSFSDAAGTVTSDPQERDLLLTRFSSLMSATGGAATLTNSTQPRPLPPPIGGGPGGGGGGVVHSAMGSGSGSFGDPLQDPCFANLCTPYNQPIWDSRYVYLQDGSNFGLQSRERELNYQRCRALDFNAWSAQQQGSCKAAKTNAATFVAASLVTVGPALRQV